MRKKSLNALISMGLSSSLRGFGYIADAMELYEQKGSSYTNMAALYDILANKYGVQWESVMDDISYAIDYVHKHGNGGQVVKYFGFMPKSVGNFLAMMFGRLQEEMHEGC